MHRWTASLLCGLAFSAVAGLSGCALTDAHANLSYAPEPGRKSPLSTLPPTSLALHVEDQRDSGERDRVGDKKNNYGMITAKILSVREPAVVIREALARELTENGHKVVDDPAASAAVIQVRLKKYWSDARIHFWDVEMIGSLAADVAILKGKEAAAGLSKPIACTFRSSTQIATDGQYEKVLNGALAEFVRSFARDGQVLRALQ